MAPFLAPEIAAPLGAVETERLVLRPPEAGDLDGLAAVFAERAVWEFPFGRALSRDETAQFLENQRTEWDECGFGCWIAELRETAAIVGYVGLSVPMFLPEILPAVEVGWRFHPAQWGRGLASEGARAALREGFLTMGLAEIVSCPQAENDRSWAVCERLGMTDERTVTCPPNERRGPVDVRLYVMTREGWAAASSG